MLILCLDKQEKAEKRAAEDDDIFSRFKKKKDDGETKSAMIPREEVCVWWCAVLKHLCYYKVF